MKPLDKFGQFLVANLRDQSIQFTDMLIEGLWKAPDLTQLQNSVGLLSSEQKQLVRRVVIESLDHGIHDFLFALQESNDFKMGINVVVDGKNIADLSDGLHGESFSEDGWNARFSKYA